MANWWWVFKPSQYFFIILFSISIIIISNGTVSVYGEESNLKDLLHNDAIRHRAFSQKVLEHQQQIRLPSIADKRRKVLLETLGINNDKHKHNAAAAAAAAAALNVAVQMRMHSAADYGIGQYLAAFKAGTPSQKFMLFVDTGSDLTWMTCKYGCKNVPNKCSTRTSLHRRVFLADSSSSFTTIPCSSDMCKLQLANLFSLAMCPSPFAPCAYDYRYLDGSSAVGIFGNETVTVSLTNGRKTKLHNVLIGCSESSGGPSFQHQVAADGVLGLGYSKSSFAIKATDEFGGKFSYCLVDHLSPRNISSYLIFGPANEKTSIGSTRYTTLGAIGSSYAVNVEGISVDGLMLNIPTEIWNVSGVGGTIIDSGSSLTYLTLPAYEPVVAALKVSLAKFHQLHLKIGPLKYCFNSTGFDESLDAPRLVFHFTDGARFEPLVKSYVIDAAKGVKCLGFVSTAWPGASIIGNIMQQNHLWEFDLIKGKLGFSPSSCT